MVYFDPVYTHAKLCCLGKNFGIDLPLDRDLGEHPNHCFYRASDVVFLVERWKDYRYRAHGLDVSFRVVAPGNCG